MKSFTCAEYAVHPRREETVGVRHRYRHTLVRREEFNTVAVHVVL